jgi:hypothetical protein
LLLLLSPFSFYFFILFFVFIFYSLFSFFLTIKNQKSTVKILNFWGQHLFSLSSSPNREIPFQQWKALLFFSSISQNPKKFLGYKTEQNFSEKGGDQPQSKQPNQITKKREQTKFNKQNHHTTNFHHNQNNHKKNS